MAKTQRGKAVFQRLLDHGVMIFSAKHHSSVGLKEIIDSIDLAKGNFYNYFRSKDDYCAAVITYYTDEMVKSLGARIACAKSDALLALIDYIEWYLERSRTDEHRHGCLISNQCSHLSESTGSYVRALQSSLARLSECFERAFRIAQEQGVARRDLPSSIMADLLLSAWLGAAMRVRVERSTAPMETVRDKLIDGYFR